MNSGNRYEIKFVFSEHNMASVFASVHSVFQATMSFPERNVHSIYLDDPAYSSVRDNIMGIAERKKYRIRWYGTDQQPCKYTLEAKIKNGRIGHKESIALGDLYGDIYNTPPDNIIKATISSLDKSSYPLNAIYNTRPTLYVKYTRKYFENQSGLRITIDSGIRYNLLNGPTSINRSPGSFTDKYVMELKFPAELKDSISSRLSKASITPTRHSKYINGLAHFSQLLHL